MRALLVWMLAAGAAWSQTASPPLAPVPPPRIEQQRLRRLLEVQRVCVSRLSGGENALQIRDMVIAALQRASLFVITEDEDRADAFLRGSAEDLIFTETRSSREGLNVRAGSRSSSRDRYSGESQGATIGIGEDDDQYSKERKHEAVASLRLVAKDGEVLWSTTQESLGAKYKGSSADVAEKVARDLAEAFARARKLATGSQAESPRPASGRASPATN